MRRVIAGLAAMGLVIVLAPMSPSQAAVAKTTIIMRIPSCNGCHIYPYNLRPDANGGTYRGYAHTVTNGTVTIVVPTSRTDGMVFRIDAPWQDEADLSPVIAFQYEGFAPGTTVTRPQARRALSASPCWAGTAAAEVTFDVAVRRVWVDGFALGNDDEYHDQRVRMPMSWVLPTQAARGPFSGTVKGIANLAGRPNCDVGSTG